MHGKHESYLPTKSSSWHSSQITEMREEDKKKNFLTFGLSLPDNEWSVAVV